MRQRSERAPEHEGWIFVAACLTSERYDDRRDKKCAAALQLSLRLFRKLVAEVDKFESAIAVCVIAMSLAL